MRKRKPITPEKLRALREARGENQSVFYERVFSGQSRGSRWERGSRAIPPEIDALIGHVYQGVPIPQAGPAAE